MKKKKAKIKFNGGNLALLCSECNAIIKVGYQFNEEELKFARGVGDLEPLYCDTCKLKRNERDILNNRREG